MSADLKPGNEAQRAVLWFDKPKLIPLDDLQQNLVALIILTAIVNPFGPTMKGLAVLSKEPVSTGPPSELQIVRFALNPFSHTVESIGLLDSNSATSQLAGELLNNIDRLGYDGSGCFTLFHPGYFLADRQTATRLGCALLLRVNGLVKELDFLKRFPNDPWRRITAEVDDADQALRDRLPERLQPAKNDKEDHAPTSADVEAFLEIIQREEHNAEELKAFVVAWKGAIENVQAGSFSDVITLEALRDIYTPLVRKPSSKKTESRKRAHKK
ncbi:MAG TPA: hypothetical protein VIE66_00295 [Methylocella sp.]